MIFSSSNNEDYFMSKYTFINDSDINDSDINDNYNEFNNDEEDNINNLYYEREKEPINSTYFHMNKDLLGFKKIVTTEESSTKDKTLLYNLAQNNINIKSKNEDGKNQPELYSFDKINEIFSEKKLNKIQEKFKKDESLKNEEKELEFSKKKKKRTYIDEDNETKMKYQKGRKNKKDQTKRNHNKMSPDNIIKKIKSKIFEMVLLFVNTILNVKNEEENNKILKDLNYMYINQLNKVIDLELLDLPLKDLLSKKISPKFKNYAPDYNEIIIEKIKKENNNEIINFVFNMTLREWLDLFTMKKNITEFENISPDKCKEIETKLPKLEIILDDIMKKNNEGDNYLTHFILYLYNYERWFFNKRERKQKKK